MNYPNPNINNHYQNELSNGNFIPGEAIPGQPIENIPIKQSNLNPQNSQINNKIIPNNNIIAPENISLNINNIDEEIMQKLNKTKQIAIKQEIEIGEVITGCETKNRYNIYLIDSKNEKTLLFKCKESSSCLMRNCCPGNIREFNMKVKQTISNNLYGNSYNNPYLIFERPFKCTCCCLARPYMKGTLMEKKMNLGFISEICTIYNPIFEIYDRDNVRKFFIKISCCQCGFFFRNTCCGKFSKVVGEIYNGDDINMNGNLVGDIVKRVSVKDFISDANSFLIDFPNDASPTDKLLILGCTLMIDYRYFEYSPPDLK